MATSLLVIGESLIDIVESSDSTIEYPGGSCFNVAVGLGKLGNAVQLLTNVGNDARGALIVESVQASGATLVSGSAKTGPTSTAKATLGADKSATYLFDIDWSLEFVETLPAAAIMHTGSIAAFLEPGASQGASLLAAAPKNTIITFDPNVRPSIIGTRDESAAVVAQLAPLCTVLKVSDEDGEWLYGTDGAATLEVMLGLGATVAVVTLGADGALIGTGAERMHIAGQKSDLIDTIGAGDSFMSAFLHGIAALLDSGVPASEIIDGTALDRATLIRLGTFAAQCAAITVSRAGANPPTLAEVQHLL